MRIKFDMPVEINCDCLDEVVFSLLLCYHSVGAPTANVLVGVILKNTTIHLSDILDKITQVNFEDSIECQNFLYECLKKDKP